MLQLVCYTMLRLLCTVLSHIYAVPYNILCLGWLIWNYIKEYYNSTINIFYFKYWFLLTFIFYQSFKDTISCFLAGGVENSVVLCSSHSIVGNLSFSLFQGFCLWYFFQFYYSVSWHSFLFIIFDWMHWVCESIFLHLENLLLLWF